MLALFPVGKLAHDGQVEPAQLRRGIRFTLGMMVDNPQDVDEMTDRMRVAGGRVAKPPVNAEFFEGRSAYVSDPEDNYWEIAWAPPDNPIVAAARRAANYEP